MFLGNRSSPARCLIVWASGTSGLGAVAGLVHAGAELVRAEPTSVKSAPLDVAIVAVAECVILGCAAWAWVALTASAADAWRGSEVALRRPWLMPLGVHRVVLAACGVALATAATAPARADAGHPPGPRDAATLLSGLPLPDRAVAPPRTAGAPTSHTHVVRPGDSLWSIAARDLPRGSSEEAIARRWHAIYAANRRRIGPDPDLIVPGQQLHLPGKDRR